MYSPAMWTILPLQDWLAIDGDVRIKDQFADRINVPDEHIGKAGSPTSVFKSFPKQLKPAGQTFEVSPEEAVELIVNKLKEKHII